MDEALRGKTIERIAIGKKSQFTEFVSFCLLRLFFPTPEYDMAVKILSLVSLYKARNNMAEDVEFPFMHASRAHCFHRFRVNAGIPAKPGPGG